MGDKYKSGFGVKGLYQKRGWFYYRPPTPKPQRVLGSADADGGARESAVSVPVSRPPAVALRTTDLVTAIQRLRDHRDTAEMEHAARSGSVAEALESYLADKGGDAVATRRARESILNRFASDLGNPKVTELNAERIGAWLAALADGGGNRRAGAGGGGLSAATVKSYAITLRAFVNWLRERKMLSGDPMARVKRNLRVAKTRRQEFVSQADRDKLLEVPMPEYLALVLHLGFFAGLRDGEMLAMTRNWLWFSEDGARGSITVQDTPVVLSDGKAWTWRPKTREMRTIPLSPRLLAFLKGYGPRDPFMVAPEKSRWPAADRNSKRFDCKKALHAAAAKAGIPKLTFHMMRHSFATHLAMNGTPLAAIAGLLGDSLRVTEDHYAGYCQSGGSAVMGL